MQLVYQPAAADVQLSKYILRFLRRFSLCANSDMQHSQSFSHHVKGDLWVQPHLSVKLFHQSDLSHFCDLSWELSHMLLSWMWWEASVRPNGGTRFQVWQMFLLISLSSLSFTPLLFVLFVFGLHHLLHSANHWEKGGVFLSTGMCVRFAQDLDINYPFESHSYSHNSGDHFWVMSFRGSWFISSRFSSVTYRVDKLSGISLIAQSRGTWKH